MADRHPFGDFYRHCGRRVRRMAMRFIAAMIELERGHPSGPDPTITPEDTLRDAGISDRRQAAYQRRMSSLLAGRE
jgi:hypothetical protein